ncbi:MAG: hypothetical protein V1708_03155 [Candidatus Micrarchaeota archaeon]
MLFVDHALKLLAKLFRVVNQRSSVIITFLFVAPATVFWFRTVWLEQPFTSQVVAVYSLVFLPFLLYKALLYFFLALFDGVVVFFAGYSKDFDVDFEKVRARVTKILSDKDVKYQSLENLALGGEKSILDRLRGILRIKYPLIFVCADEPFIVIKIFRSIWSPRIGRLMNQITHKEAISVKIFFAEDPKATVLAKMIMNSLEVLKAEEQDAEKGDAPAQDLSSAIERSQKR